MAADRNLDVVLALAAAAWKAGVPADEIIRVVQTIDLEPRETGEKNASDEPGKTFAGGANPPSPDALDLQWRRYQAEPVYGTDKPAKPE